MLRRCVRSLISTIVVAIALLLGACTSCHSQHPKECHFDAMADRVRDFLAKRQFEAALQDADLLVERYGDSDRFASRAHYVRAQVHVQRDDGASAIRDLTAAVDACSESQLMRLIKTVARGRCREHFGMPQAAAQDYRAVYDALVQEYEEDNRTEGSERHNYMDLIDFFWSHRQYTDQDFGFKQLEFAKDGSYRETKRARREAVLNWLREFVDVHPKIIANIHDVDAKVYSLTKMNRGIAGARDRRENPGSGRDL